MPPDLVQLNKRVVHRQMEIMGLRTGIRAGSELCALGIHSESVRRFVEQVKEKGVAKAAQDRDQTFGDYRTRHGKE